MADPNEYECKNGICDYCVSKQTNFPCVGVMGGNPIQETSPPIKKSQYGTNFTTKLNKSDHTLMSNLRKYDTTNLCSDEKKILVGIIKVDIVVQFYHQKTKKITMLIRCSTPT